MSDLKIKVYEALLAAQILIENIIEDEYECDMDNFHGNFDIKPFVAVKKIKEYLEYLAESIKDKDKKRKAIDDEIEEFAKFIQVEAKYLYNEVVEDIACEVNDELCEMLSYPLQREDYQGLREDYQQPRENK